MERSIELVRDILLGIEATCGHLCSESELVKYLERHGYDLIWVRDSNDVIYEHCRIMQQAGFIEFTDPKAVQGEMRSQIQHIKMAWQGYELLDVIRNKDVWDATQKKVWDANLLNASLEIMKSVATEICKEKIIG